MKTKEFNGTCLENNKNKNINVTFITSETTTNGYMGQKHSFECDNQKCEHYLKQNCPIFMNIPFPTEIDK